MSKLTGILGIAENVAVFWTDLTKIKNNTQNNTPEDESPLLRLKNISL